MRRILNWLKNARQRKGLSQSELAKLTDIDANALSRYERGVVTPSIEMAKKIAKALNITVDELLNGTPDESWTLELKIDNTVKEMIDMTENMPCVASITGTQNGALLTLSGKWDTFRDDAKFQDFIDQLVKARGKILRLGEDWD